MTNESQTNLTRKDIASLESLEIKKANDFFDQIFLICRKVHKYFLYVKDTNDNLALLDRKMSWYTSSFGQ